MAGRGRDQRHWYAHRVSPATAGVAMLVPTLTLAVGLSGPYGRIGAARFGLAATGALAAQQSLVALALRREAVRGGRDSLGLVDLLTLGRGLAAAVLAGLAASGARDRRGPAGWVGWLALSGASVACDWLDGPVARRLGTSPAGAAFDLETDSWLTLAAAGSAVAWGGLPPYSMAAPALRYVLLALALRRLPYKQIFAAEPSWARWSGIAQMLLFTAALAPFGGRFTRPAVRLAAPVIAPLQVGVMLVLHRRLRDREAGP